jgi:hypothetical protein
MFHGVARSLVVLGWCLPVQAVADSNGVRGRWLARGAGAAAPIKPISSRGN